MKRMMESRRPWKLQLDLSPLRQTGQFDEAKLAYEIDTIVNFQTFPEWEGAKFVQQLHSLNSWFWTAWRLGDGPLAEYKIGTAVRKDKVLNLSVVESPMSGGSKMALYVESVSRPTLMAGSEEG